MDLDRVRSIWMRDVASHYGFSVVRGNILCPFHSDTKPSCRIYEHGFFCFACNTGGDVIRFVERYEKVKFLDAVAKLCEISNIPFDRKFKPNPKRNILKDNYSEMKAVLLNELDKTKFHLRNLFWLKRLSKHWDAKLWTEYHYTEYKCDVIEEKLKELEHVRFEC